MRPALCKIGAKMASPRVISCSIPKHLLAQCGIPVDLAPAAAELFFQGLGFALVGFPRTVVDEVRFEGAFRNNSGLADKVGARILPDFIALKDSPVELEFPIIEGARRNRPEARDRSGKPGHFLSLHPDG